MDKGAVDERARARLVRMAGQIAAFFAAYPHDQAVQGVADHINAFWTPSMREDLRALAGAPDLHPLAAAAMGAIRPAPQS